MLLPRAAALRGAALLVAIVIQIAPIQAAKQCYWMDGTITDSVVQPCNPDAEVSPCCALNKAKPDLCLSSGLCYSQDSGVEGFLYSDGCTDRTGEDEKCPHFCIDRKENLANEYTRRLPCAVNVCPRANFTRSHPQGRQNGRRTMCCSARLEMPAASSAAARRATTRIAAATRLPS